MQKLGFPTMKSLDQFKSLSSKNFSSFLPSRPTSADSSSSGSFANLKLTAEKLVKEQASVKTDLDFANSKLKKAVDHIRELEEKLQNAFNENAKLKVKQKEDEKLWKGLESKFTSTKTLCDQLTETMQLLAGQVQDAEKDKQLFEGKLSAASNALENLNQQLNCLSLKLTVAEESIENGEKEVEKLKSEREETNKMYREELSKTALLVEEKDHMLKKFEETVEANRVATNSLSCKLAELQLELRLKEDQIMVLASTQERLEKDKSDLQLRSNDCAAKLALSLQEIEILKGFVGLCASQLSELDKQSLMFGKKFDELNSLYDACFNLLRKEKILADKQAKNLCDQLNKKLLFMKSEKDGLESLNEELNDKILELQKDQKSLMEKLSEECRLAGETIGRLESEAELLKLKKNEADISTNSLEAKIAEMSTISRLSENKMQELLQKISALEIEKRDDAEKFAEDLNQNIERIETLQLEMEKQDRNAESLGKQIVHLNSTLEEKEQIILQCHGREKNLENCINENQELLVSTENRLTEAKKQYDMMLESKQLELSRHLKEISLRNDQAINEMRKKYESEKLEIVQMEKEKADKLIEAMESKGEQMFVESREEARQQLVRTQEEHAARVLQIQQEYDRRETSFKASHNEEIRRVILQAESELSERTMQLRNEHEVQMKALQCQHEDECKQLQEELDLQRSKEERQRALLQLQWKVMGDKPQDEQEVNSKKDYSISSIKRRDTGGAKRSRRTFTRQEDEEKDPSYIRITQTPVSKILKKVENAETGSVISIPKHHKKVTHHEYKVETSNGRTITEHRKTKSTVMFQDPRKPKKGDMPKAITPRSIGKRMRDTSTQRPSNIGDLFSEGALNPYADDPYAFD